MSNEDLRKFNELVSSEKLPDMGSDCEASTPVDPPIMQSDNEKAKMWAVYGESYIPCEKAVNTLPPGQYTITYNSEHGVYFSYKNINLDELLTLPDSASEEVIESIEVFWKKEKHFRKFGFLWKRGVLLWGPAGSGKTSTLQMISKRIIDKGGISIYSTDPGLTAMGLELLRKIEPIRPIVVMIEDIDAVVREHGEASLLALLDGELQIDNVIFIATTNYPEKLDKRLVNRPSRFDIVKLIDMPSPAARRVYLKNKNDRFKNDKNITELEIWVQLSKGFSVAHLKELIISVEVFEVDLEEAVERLRSMMEISISSDILNKKTIGFSKT